MSCVPPSWVLAPVGDLVELSPKNSCADSTEVGFVPLQRLGVDYRSRHTFDTRQWAEVKKGYTQFADGDVLLARITPSFENGKAGIVRNLPNGVGAGSTEYFVCRPYHDALLPEYLLAHFKTPRFLRDGKQVMSGAAGQQRVPKQYVLDSRIPLAPLAEQKRIVDKLDAVLARVDACRERLDRLPDILKRFRHAVLAAATSGTLTEDWRESASKPDAWTNVRLDQIADVAGGLTKDAKKQSDGDAAIPYLRVANVQRGYLDLSEVKTIRVPNQKLASLLLEPGDILFTEGGDIDKLGRGWVWEGQIARCTHQNHVFRARLFDKANQPKYISWWGNHRGLDFFLKGGKQTTNLASINKSQLRALPISLPPSDEQAEIVHRVGTLFAYADRLEARYAAARAQVERLAPALIEKAFRGELVPQDPNDEPASVLLGRIRAACASTPAKPKRHRTMRKAKMAKPTRASVKEIIAGMAAEIFTFDDLRAHVASDYESLKSIVFELLAEPDPSLRQVFDTKAKALRFVRLKS